MTAHTPTAIPVTLWVFMRMLPPEEEKDGWEIMGVFSSRDRAIAACTLNRDLIFPLRLDERLPDETQPLAIEWPCGNGGAWSYDYLTTEAPDATK